MDNKETAKLSVAIHKIAWVVHLLASSAQSRRSNVGFRQVVGLILEVSPGHLVSSRMTVCQRSISGLILIGIDTIVCSFQQRPTLFTSLGPSRPWVLCYQGSTQGPKSNGTSRRSSLRPISPKGIPATTVNPPSRQMTYYSTLGRFWARKILRTP